MRVLRFLVAAPIAALLVAVAVMVARPDGPVTGRDREVKARLTRNGLQRLDTDGGHWAVDALEVIGVPAPAADAVQPLVALPVARAEAPPAPLQVTRLAVPPVRRSPGRAPAPPGRDRAPPRR